MIGKFDHRYRGHDEPGDCAEHDALSIVVLSWIGPVHLNSRSVSLLVRKGED